MEFGGNIDSRSRNFRTPLHIACIRGKLGIIQAVLMAGADINAKDIDGNTPCHFCSEYGHKDCLRYLLLKHPSLFSKNKDQQSPLDVAVNTEILQVRTASDLADLPRVHHLGQKHPPHQTEQSQAHACARQTRKPKDSLRPQRQQRGLRRNCERRTDLAVPQDSAVSYQWVFEPKAPAASGLEDARLSGPKQDNSDSRLRRRRLTTS